MSKKKEPYESSIALCKWALRFGYEQYDMTPAAKLAGGAPIGSGLGLVGLDGAAQAGMVLREISALSQRDIAFVAAKCAPRSIDCQCGSPCCRGWKDNPTWETSIQFIATLIHDEAVIDCASARLRRMLVEKSFGRKHKYVEIAKLVAMHRTTVAGYSRTVEKWIASMEYQVWVEFEDRLVAVRMINKDAA